MSVLIMPFRVPFILQCNFTKTARAEADTLILYTLIDNQLGNDRDSNDKD